MRIYRNKKTEFVIDKKAQKYILSQPIKRRAQIYEAIYQLPAGTDIKKLRGYRNRYRVRLGGIRIMFEKVEAGDVLKIFVNDIDNRGGAYKK